MSSWLWFLPNSAHSDGQVVFCACRWIRRNTLTETAHFWMQYTLTFCTHLAPRVTVGYVLWPPGARGLQIFMSASVVTMLFSQHVALCQCWLVSQHGTGIWNCFARKVATYQLMLADSCLILVMERYRNLNQAYLKWWEQFSRRSYELLALILTKLSSLWRASGFLCMPLIRRNTLTETAHFWMQYVLTFAPILHPESPWGVYCGLLVLGDCKYSCQLRLWPCYFPSTLHFVNAGWYRSMEQVFGTVLLERLQRTSGC